MKKWRDLGLFDAGGEVWDCGVVHKSHEAQGGEQIVITQETDAWWAWDPDVLPPAPPPGPELCRHH